MKASPLTQVRRHIVQIEALTMHLKPKESHVKNTSTMVPSGPCQMSTGG